MTNASALRVLLLAVLIAATGCATRQAAPPRVAVDPAAPAAAPPPATTVTPPPAPLPAPPAAGATVRREFFESANFVVAFARAGDTAATLAARFLGDARKAWMITEFMGAQGFEEGQEIVIPKRDWNQTGIYPSGYQIVPVLVYHNIGPAPKGRLLMAAQAFEQQMRHLHSEGFHAVTLDEFLDFIRARRQLPRKSVLIAFDDGYHSFARHARPVLKELGYPATLFVYTDFVGAGATALGWHDLRALSDEGFDVAAHSKTHGDLRRQAGESDASYARRLDHELGVPLTMFQKHLGRGSVALAYPFGATDDEVQQKAREHGYLAAFTVRRQANPAFVAPLRISRAQIFSDMTLPQFMRNVVVFHDEVLEASLPEPRPGAGASVVAAAMTTAAPAASPLGLAARHRERAEALEQRGYLRQALHAWQIALTIAPDDASSRRAAARVEAEIERRAAHFVAEGHRLLRVGAHGEARRMFLAALVLDPGHRTAFDALQHEVRDVAFIAHTVRAGDTLASIADLYYGDVHRAEVIAETNRVPLNAQLAVGRSLRIPEIPGIPFLPR